MINISRIHGRAGAVGVVFKFAVDFISLGAGQKVNVVGNGFSR